MANMPSTQLDPASAAADRILGPDWREKRRQRLQAQQPDAPASERPVQPSAAPRQQIAPESLTAAADRILGPDWREKRKQRLQIQQPDAPKTAIGRERREQWAGFLSGEDKEGNPVVVKPEDVSPQLLEYAIEKRKEFAKDVADKPNINTVWLKDFKDDTAAMERDLEREWLNETSVESYQRRVIGKMTDEEAIAKAKSYPQTKADITADKARQLLLTNFHKSRTAKAIAKDRAITAYRPKPAPMSLAERWTGIVDRLGSKEQAPKPSLARRVGEAAGELGGRMGTFGIPLGGDIRNIPQAMLSATQAAAPRMLEGWGHAAQRPFHATAYSADKPLNRLVFGDLLKHVEIPNPFDMIGQIGAIAAPYLPEQLSVDKARAAVGRQATEFAGGMLESTPIRPGKDVQAGVAPWKRRWRALSEAAAQVALQVGGAIASGGSTAVATLPMAMQETGASYNQNLQRLLEEGKPRAEAEKTAGQAATDHGAMIWLTEKLGLDVILKGLPAAARGRVAAGVKQQLERFVGKKLSPEAKWVMLTMEDGIAASLMEGTQEGTQEILGSAINRFGAGDEKAFDNIVERTIEASSIGAIVGGGASVATGGDRGGESQYEKDMTRLRALPEKLDAPDGEVSRQDAIALNNRGVIDVTGQKTADRTAAMQEPEARKALEQAIAAQNMREWYEDNMRQVDKNLDAWVAQQQQKETQRALSKEETATKTKTEAAEPETEAKAEEVGTPPKRLPVAKELPVARNYRPWMGAHSTGHWMRSSAPRQPRK
jgi:hypothetical protein